MDKPVEALEYETMLLIRHTYLNNLRGEGLERSAYILLSRLELDGPLSIGQLSEAFGLDTSTLNRQTSAMMKADLVQRIPDPDGGIARKFRITEYGSERLRAVREVNTAGLAKIVDDWSPDELEAFVSMLVRFNHDIERHVGRPWPRPEGAAQR